MQARMAALIEALGRAEPRKRKPADGRQVVAGFRLRRGEATRSGTFIKSVPYVSGKGGGLGGCKVELEVEGRSGYVTTYFGDGPEQALTSAIAASAGWRLEPGSLALSVALGFPGAKKAALATALAAVLELGFS